MHISPCISRGDGRRSREKIFSRESMRCVVGTEATDAELEYKIQKEKTVKKCDGQKVQVLTFRLGSHT